ncbi:Barstar (barnase inhibitor) [[Clostridium] aminophilum]|uniref:Barstar (Barnase inhibitor) n=2 Tax=[Clostridium] aminophilum TaxID=1526 RepID=A0A1I6K8Q8_9FIRM|nr:Barstar (barnase inhibitor) [[Clostridium] aminophilum]
MTVPFPDKIIYNYVLDQPIKQGDKTMKLIEIDLNKMQSEKEIHEILAKEFEFPNDYAMTMDALRDLLKGNVGNGCIRVTHCADASSPMAEAGACFEKILEECAETIQEEGDAIYAVFADKSQEDPRNWGMAGQFGL